MNTVYALRGKIKEQVQRSLERDRSKEQQVNSLFKILWPWKESWLMVLIVIGILMDYTSTYILLELSGKTNVYEAGWMASRALDIGGFGALILVDLAAIAILLTAAVAAKKICLRLGFEGYARAMFIVLLLPYTIMAFFATTNNLILTFI